MSELISGKEALRALVDGKEVENFNGSAWWSVDESWEVGAFLSDRKFRLKPRTIMLNGIGVPAPDHIEKNPNLHGGWAFLS